MIFEIIRLYVIICCLNFLLYNALLKLFMRRIFENGWPKKIREEEEKCKQEHPEVYSRVEDLSDNFFVDFLTLFIPTICFPSTFDLIRMIVTKAE